MWGYQERVGIRLCSMYPGDLEGKLDPPGRPGYTDGPDVLGAER